MMVKTTKAPTSFRDRLLQTLEHVNRPGAVCTSGDLPLTMPGLVVDDVGAIRFPLGKTQARQLIKQCRQAPYGQGTKTVVDVDVRRVWELDPQRFALTNPKWDELIASIVGQVQAALGLDNEKFQAHLYKLLVYEKGSFFLSHQDGEKLAGMVATLVVGLPSVHAGGELIVTHEGQRRELALAGAASGHELSYAAFYADCQHEVLPLREGYRLCLTYNLTLARTSKKKSIGAPRTTEAVNAASQVLREWPSGESLPKVAVALAHQYTQSGLRIDALKGVDRARAEVLFDAAEQAGCVAHLALATHWQSGSAEGGYDPYSSYRSRRSWSYDEDESDDDDEADRASDYEMGEVYDESLSLDHWSDRNGKKVPFGEIDVRNEEIVSDQPREAWTLGREEFEGYTGNAGMTLERWYHQAAVVLWPQKNHFAVLCGAGTDAAIAGLEAMVKQAARARKADQPARRQSCLQFAAAIIESWEPARFRYSHASQSLGERIDRGTFPQLLEQLADPETTCRFIASVLPQDGDVQLAKTFPAFCRKHGWRAFEESLSAVCDKSTAETIQRNAETLEILCVQRDKDAERQNLGQRLGERLVVALEGIDGGRPKHDWQTRRSDRAALLVSLVKSLLAVDAEAPLSRLIEHALSLEKKYDLIDVHLAAVFKLEAWLCRHLDKPHRGIARWLSCCRAELEKRTASPPAPPLDFRREAKFSCTCGDCRELKKFLADPAASVHRFPVAQDRRQHLHQVIDGARCDLTHVTTRTGRPYTLVCTKTTASYEAACQTHARDVDHLKRLRDIESILGRAVDAPAHQRRRSSPPPTGRRRGSVETAPP